ncbi:UNVERIFIED_CONTAM: hypothetical protein HDU68_001862, partial [Siphonaria sp. JEL0065]
MPSVLGNEKPIFTYWNRAGGGRGEVNRLFFAEAGIEFEDVRIDFEDWPAKKAELIKSGVNHFGAIPTLQIGDLVLTQSIPILRFVAKKIGKYGGSNDLEAYKLDQFSDVAIDWRFSFAKQRDIHPVAIPRFYNTFENLLVGPFILGEEFSYADAILYQALHDDGSLGNESRLAEYPKLQKFVAAFEARPRIAEYLANRKSQYGVQMSESSISSNVTEVGSNDELVASVDIKKEIIKDFMKRQILIVREQKDTVTTLMIAEQGIVRPSVVTNPGIYVSSDVGMSMMSINDAVDLELTAAMDKVQFFVESGDDLNQQNQRRPNGSYCSDKNTSATSLHIVEDWEKGSFVRHPEQPKSSTGLFSNVAAAITKSKQTFTMMTGAIGGSSRNDLSAPANELDAFLQYSLESKGIKANLTSRPG